MSAYSVWISAGMTWLFPAAATVSKFDEMDQRIVLDFNGIHPQTWKMLEVSD
jgi:hypothetical protein